MGARSCERFRAGKRLWDAADEVLLLARYPHEPTPAIARLGLSKSAEYLASPDACRLRRGDHPGAAFQFKKGHVPANKGLRRPGWAPGRMGETQFKLGQRGSRWMPVGSTRVVDGYLYTKVRDLRSTKAGAGFVPWARNWKVTHVLLWEKHHHRRMPRHHALAFKNGDRTDIRLDNLELITRRRLMARTSRACSSTRPRSKVDFLRVTGGLRSTGFLPEEKDETPRPKLAAATSRR